MYFRVLINLIAAYTVVKTVTDVNMETVSILKENFTMRKVGITNLNAEIGFTK